MTEMVRRLLQTLTTLSLLLFVAVAVLWVSDSIGVPWHWMRGSTAGGAGFSNGEIMTFWAGDLTGVATKAPMREVRFPGFLLRRVYGPRPSCAVLLAHWLALAATGALPAGMLAARTIGRARRRPGFPVAPADGA